MSGWFSKCEIDCWRVLALLFGASGHQGEHGGVVHSRVIEEVVEELFLGHGTRAEEDGAACVLDS